MGPYSSLLSAPISNRIAGLFLAVLVMILYANSLPNKFIWDDEEQIVNNQVIRDFGNLPEILTSSTFYAGGAGLSGGFYRPMVSFSYLLNYQIWGLQPWAFRMFQIFFHILNALLIFLIFQKMLSDHQVRDGKTISFLAALIFAVHPVGVESVAYIASVGEVLYSFFALISFWVILKGANYREGRIEDKFLWWSIALAFLGLLAKENAIVIFPIIALYLFLFLDKKPSAADETSPRRGFWEKFAREKAAFIKYSLSAAAAALAYLFLRIFAVGISLSQPHIAPIAKASLAERLLTIPYELLSYVKILFFPSALFIYRNFVVTSPLHARFWGGIFALLLLGALVFMAIRKMEDGASKKICALGAFWFLIGLAPMLNLIPLDMTIAERWLYFPMIGALLVMGVVSVHAYGKLSSGARKIIFALLILCVALLSMRTIIRNTDWKDGLTLYEHDTKYSQDNANLLNNYGVELFRAGDIAGAEEHFRKSIALENEWSVSHNNLGAVLEKKNEFEQAEGEYRKSIEVSDYYLAYQNAAGLLLKMEETERAQAFLENALKKFPRNSTFSFMLAVIHYRRGEIERAIALLEESLESDPQNEQAIAVYRMIRMGERIEFER